MTQHQSQIFLVTQPHNVINGSATDGTGRDSSQLPASGAVATGARKAAIPQQILSANDHFLRTLNSVNEILKC